MAKKKTTRGSSEILVRFELDLTKKQADQAKRHWDLFGYLECAIVAQVYPQARILKCALLTPTGSLRMGELIKRLKNG